VRTLVFNGWAAGPETWGLCTFPHDYVFSYLEQLDGVPEKVMEETDEAVLVGFSMGGSTALRMLLRYPEKVKGLVLISATPRMMEERADCEGRSAKDEGDAGTVVWKGMTLRRRAALKLGTQQVFRNDPSPLYAEHNFDRGLDYLQNTDLRAELRRWADERRETGDGRETLPVFIFQSERDGIVRPNNAAFLKGVFPQAKVTLVSGNEHVLPVTVPELIDEAVNEMLEFNRGAIPPFDRNQVQESPGRQQIVQ